MAFKKDAKTDNSKLRFDLINPEFLEGMAKILTHGANKYGANNFRKASKEERKLYIGALHRHLNQWQQGKKLDQDHKQNHLISVAVNAMFLYYFDSKELDKNE
jgi:hypothetical protein